MKTYRWPDNQTVQPRKLLAFLLTALLLASVLGAAGDKLSATLQRATHAKTYPAHETHDDEGVSIAIDPFDMPDKTASFRVKYKENDILPVRLIISNDGDKTVMLDDLQVKYITVSRDKLEPLATGDLYRRLARTGNIPGRKPPLPIPLPRKNKSAVPKEDIAEIDSLQFSTVPVTAHSTNGGFLFFDISGIETPEAGAHIYLSGIKINGKELFYFDIPLEKYLNYHPGK